MPRERRAFRQGDVTAAIKATKNAGESVARVEVDPDGKVTVFVGQPEDCRLPDTRNERIAERFYDALHSKKPARSRKGSAT